MKKRILSWLMVVLMIFSTIPATALAADRDTEKAQAHVVVENTTFTEADGAPWEGILVDTWVDINDSSTVMTAVVDAIEAEGYTQEGGSSGYISEVNGLKAMAEGTETGSGWMGTLNDWFVNEGFDKFTPEDGDEICIMYTNCAFDNIGEDIGGSWANNDTSLKAVEFSAGELDQAFTPEVTDYTLTVPEGTKNVQVIPTAANKNFQVRTSADGTEYKRTAQVPVTDGTVLTVKCGDPSWPTMNTGEITATTYSFTVKASGEPAPAPGYLDLLRVCYDGAGGTTDGFTFDKDTNEYTMIVPANAGTSGYIGAMLSDAAPGGSYIEVKYWSYSFNKEWTRTISSTDTSITYVSGMWKNDGNENTIHITAGTDLDNQQYTVHVIRQAAINNVSFTESSGSEASVVDHMVYVSESSDILNVNVDAFDAAVTINGQDAVSKEAFEITPVWDVNGEMELVIGATYGTEEQSAESQTYTLKRVSDGAAMGVDTLIDKIGTVTADSKTVIETARNAYNALTDAQKENVTKYDVLTAAEVDYVELLITAIGKVHVNSRTDITTARNAYDALLEELKADVENYDALSAAEAQLDKLLDVDTNTFYPVITDFPQAGKEFTYYVGDEADPITVGYSVPEGSIMSYTWYRASEPTGSNGRKSVGNEESCIPDTSSVSDGWYYCYVKNKVDGKTYTSDTTDNFERVHVIVTVKELDAPEITKQPLDARYVKGVTPGALSVTATALQGSTVTYQWYKGTDKDNFTAIEGATNSTYKAPTSETGTFYYYCEVTATWKDMSESTNSQAAEFTVVDVETEEGELWEGTGTQEDPYLISGIEDLKTLQTCVNEKGYFFGYSYFKLTEDITVPVGFGYIGGLKPGATSTGSGTNIWPFSGCLDGDGHTITIEAGGKTPFYYVRGAWFKNLNIYGEQIEGYGFVDGYTVDYGENADYWGGETPKTATFNNCTLKSGSKTLKSGFIGGFASGQNLVSIEGCTVEEGVVIGYDKTQSSIGSFAGSYNGSISDCESYATVYGVSFVGGIMGVKGQSMGPCSADNCYFGGEIEATGNLVGGIVGGGYSSSSAPNTPCVSIRNCTSDGSITGLNKVGGIFGGENGCKQCWANGIGYIQKNSFKGTVSATEENAFVGGIIGFMKSLDRYNIIEDNTWKADCGAETGIGSIEAIDYTTAAYGRDKEFIVDEVCTPAAATLKVTFDKDYYKSGDIVTMKAALFEGKLVNVLGYSVQYDSSVMTYISSSAEQGFTDLRAAADKNTGSLMRAVYVPDGNSITPDENGIVFDTVTFMMIADGKPSVDFTCVENDMDFDKYPICVMSDGVNVHAFTEVNYSSYVVPDMEAAAAVSNLIDAIGTVTLDSADAIRAARSSYDGLTDAQKQYVENIDTLEMAEARYDLWTKGDVNFDTMINLKDLSQMLSVYGTENVPCDITMDGTVNANDFSILLTNYGTKLGF